MNYGEIFGKAWKITWKHKLLWIPAILLNAVILLYTFCNTAFTGLSTPESLAQNSSALLKMMGYGATICFTTLLVIALEVILTTANLVIVSRGTCQADQGTEPLLFRELAGSVKFYFWRILGLDLLLGLISVAIILPFACIGFFWITSLSLSPENIASKMWVISPLSGLFGIFFGGFFQQANQSLILENLGISEAFSRGWRIYTRFWGANVLVGFLLILLNLGMVYLIGLPQTLFIPHLKTIITDGGLDTPTVLLYSAVAIAYLPIYSILAGILATYYQSAWTLTFLRLTKLPVPSGMVSVENA